MYTHTKHLKADRPQPCDRCGGLIQQGDPIHETIVIEGDVMTVTITHDDEYIACEQQPYVDYEARAKELERRLRIIHQHAIQPPLVGGGGYERKVEIIAEITHHYFNGEP